VGGSELRSYISPFVGQSTQDYVAVQVRHCSLQSRSWNL